MKKHIFILFLALGTLFGCASAQTQNAARLLGPAQFQEKIEALAGAVIIDVRTPGEFAGGHLEGAVNYDWYGATFADQIAKLDKTKPVFVYCQSGRRSAAATAKMQSEGFKEIYELSGGIAAWQAAGLPVSGRK